MKAKTNKITKTMKYELSFEKDLYRLLDEISYVVWKVKNRATTATYDWQQYSFSYQERFGEYPKAKDVLGKTLPADIYSQLKDTEGVEIIATTIYDASIQEAIKKFENDKVEILKGNQAISQYRRDGSFPMKAQGIKKLEKVNDKNYTVNLSLLSNAGAKTKECKTQIPVKLKTGHGANIILDRILKGEYKMCDSRISKTKNKYYLLLTYQFEKEETKLDANNILGVDLGIVNAAYMATNFSPERFAIEGNEIITFRQKVEQRRISMLRQTKYAGEGRRGRGRKTLLKPTEKLRHKIDDFRRTSNHKYSKFIVETAEKMGCGVIQMEKLEFINERSTFLKNWSYYELQSFVKYKAKEKGIEVKLINPAYTSQRCSCCGYIAKGNRTTQATFECVQCNFKANADYNAAKNISLPDIESRIEAELKRQKHEMELLKNG